jgi:GrpB-like predicted nucleotidyltransferase (UPF0157 family)
MPDLVVPYDPDWPERFEEEAERVRETLGQVVSEIEHIGSTAVPGVSAKPTIDIAVGVSQLNDVDTEAITAMEELGYVYRGEAGVPGRHYFRKGATYPRDFHVSIIEWRGPLWEDYLLLRDYLRAHSEEAAAYVDAKREAERAIESPDPIAYWEHKRAFVEELLARARTSASAS